MAAPNDPQALGLAQAIATGGSAGAQAFKQAQSDLAGQKNASVNSAASRAGLVNAPTDFLKQQAAQLSAPFDQASNAAGAAQNALGAYTGALGGAHSNYLQELSAAKPILQAELDKGAQGANLNQLLQLANFKNSQEDREYTKSQRDIALTKQQKELDDTAVQQDALNKILTHPNKSVAAAAQKYISTGQSLPAVLSDMNSADGQKALAKLGVKNASDVQAVTDLVTQYYDPTTFKAVQATRAASTNSPTPTASPQSGGHSFNPSEWLSTFTRGLSGNGGRAF